MKLTYRVPYDLELASQWPKSSIFWSILATSIETNKCSPRMIYLSALGLLLELIRSMKMYEGLLRVRAVFHKTVRVYHVYCNFKIGFTCRITIIFGTLKDGSLLINTLASNICFSYRNMFQNGVDALSKTVDAFLSKSSQFYLVQIIRQCSNLASLWHKHLLRNYKWHFRLPMSAFATAI